ncbi:hypothetical protein [Maritimibacter fusiformis]|uniref:Uncharacterized protein n=1 Tax=Maritimibacter fusiformis TaxID=2603819 RepID=A0A5D0RG02_9RHOB|nr:hypothetical protein [Maritimibacter fusiformis]TYB80432.1 hypothetical protein FVF75_12350 [Maritimibacter fusiformis]
MSFHRAFPDVGLRFEAPVSLYLENARARLGRQKQYARLLAKGGRAADGLRGWLDEAAACIAELARPQAVFLPVAARVEADAVRIADRVTLEDAALARDVAAGGTVAAYLLTLGFDQAAAFERLGGDYAAHHVQSDLAGEVLFALGRDAHARFRAEQPAARLRRIPVQAHALCGERKVWDPARVQALLGVFDGVNPGVSVTATGCFQPLNSLLGLTVRR